MNFISNFCPDWASMPGDTISEILQDRNITVEEFALLSSMTIEDVKALIEGYKIIDAKIASILSSTLGGSIDFWLRREKYFRQTINEIAESQSKKWLEELPLRDMINFHWIKNSEDKLAECLTFFNVPNFWTWKKRYTEFNTIGSFRKSNKLKSRTSSLIAWVRQGEIKADNIYCKSWNSSLFFENLNKIKSFSRRKDALSFFPELRSLCAECGVALVVTQTPEGCAASGLAKFISSQKGLIQISFRHRTDDQFWFTFFHEVGHLMLHGDKKPFVDEDDEHVLSSEENEANDFALNILIPLHIQVELQTEEVSPQKIKVWANEANVSTGIIVGQLQKLNRIPFSHFNAYKKRYSFEKIKETY